MYFANAFNSKAASFYSHYWAKLKQGRSGLSYMMDIYVANLRDDVSEDALIGVFENIGIVVEVRIIRGDAKRQTYAVVTMMPDEFISERTINTQSVISLALTK